MQQETVDQLKTEPGVVLSVPMRQMNGGEGFENGAVPGKIRRCTAHQIRHGAPKWRARRDRCTRDGGERFSPGFDLDLPKRKSGEPSVGDAERVSAREPRLGQFLACSALIMYEAGSAYRMQPYIRSNARAVDRSLALNLRYSVSDGPCGHCMWVSVPRVGHISRQYTHCGKVLELIDLRFAIY